MGYLRITRIGYGRGTRGNSLNTASGVGAGEPRARSPGGRRFRRGATQAGSARVRIRPPPSTVEGPDAEHSRVSRGSRCRWVEQDIELQEVVHDAGGMRLLRVRIREKSRFTIFDVDPVTARQWGEAMRRWSDAQPRGTRRRPPVRPDDRGGRPGAATAEGVGPTDTQGVRVSDERCRWSTSCSASRASRFPASTRTRSGRRRRAGCRGSPSSRRRASTRCGRRRRATAWPCSPTARSSRCACRSGGSPTR